jgi:hypothetical protein
MSFSANIDPRHTGIARSCAAIAKEWAMPNGVSVSPLHSGSYAVAVHEDDRRAIIELTPSEMADLIGQLKNLGAA